MAEDGKQFKLEQLGQDHIEAVLALENLIFTSPWSKEEYLRLMQAGICKLFGAWQGDILAAYASVSLNAPASELEIYNIATHPDFRRQGLAQRLVSLILEAAGSLGLDRAMLEVRESNQPAKQLYEGLGLRLAGRRPRYYTRPDEDALLYEYSFKITG